MTAVVGLRHNVGRLVLAVFLVLAIVLAAWYALTRKAARRLVGIGLVVVLAVAEIAVLLSGERHGILLLALASLIGVAVAATRVAMPDAVRPSPTPVGAPVGPAARGVLIMNLRSGGGKAERFHLEEEARLRGIEPVVLRPGDDLRQLAVDVIDEGADVIGMAGGDGSQALVASVAAEHDVAHVCIPAGTRNHFALDLGLDRDDVLGALDAFGPAIERDVDLATVNGRVFVNNVSLGVYAEIVQSESYRDAKRRTTTTMLPELLGPDAPPFDLQFEGPDGATVDGAQVIQVSNNRYVLTRLTGGFGSRERLDAGVLGIAAVRLTRDRDVARFVALESTGSLDQFEGWLEWQSTRFEVRSGAPVAAGVDGEALRLDPPLVFEIQPAAVRIRIPTHAPGRSPARIRADRSLPETARALVGVALGRSRGR